MDQNLLSEAQRLISRAQANGHSGTLEDPRMVESINLTLECRVPPWYAELITTVPLCGLEFGWQSSEPTSGDDGVSWMVWLGAARTGQEMLEAYPGLAILNHRLPLCWRVFARIWRPVFYPGR